MSQDAQNKSENLMLKIGDLVSHFKFKKGKVLEINLDKNEILVDFNRDEPTRLVLTAKLDKLSPEGFRVFNDADLARQKHWLKSTFFNESEDKEHYMGSHWEAFTENKAEIFKRLPVYVECSVIQDGYGTMYPGPMPAPNAWDKCFQMVYPNQSHGLSTVLEITPTGNLIKSVFPFYSYGSQIDLKIERVDVWQSGVEAQITASWGDASVSFFDTRFIHNRAWYMADNSYDFVLTGIAYSSRPANISPIKITRPPALIARLKELLGEDNAPDESESELHFDGAAMFSPIPEWDIDDYKFHAPIKSVKPIDDFLDQKGWLVVATVMRGIGLEQYDADLKIVITEHAWQGEKAPQIGQDIEGTLWLQGYLWRVANKQQY